MKKIKRELSTRERERESARQRDRRTERRTDRQRKIKMKEGIGVTREERNVNKTNVQAKLCSLMSL